MHAAERELEQNGRVVANAIFVRCRGSPFPSIRFGTDAARERPLQAFGRRPSCRVRPWQVSGEPASGVTATESERRYGCVAVVALMRHPDTGVLLRHFGSRVIEWGPDGKASLSGDWVCHDRRLAHASIDEVHPLRHPTAFEQMLARPSYLLMEPQLREGRRAAELIGRRYGIRRSSKPPSWLGSKDVRPRGAEWPGIQHCGASEALYGCFPQPRQGRGAWSRLRRRAA